MRVLLLTHYFPEHRGGVEIVAGELASRLVGRGAQILWVASREAATSAGGPMRRSPAPAWNIIERRLGFPYPLWSPRTFLRLGRQVRACDIVHLHDSLYLGNVVAYLWARRFRKPVVVTQHVGPIPYSGAMMRGMLGLANRTLARLLLGGCDQVVFISPRVQIYFAGLTSFRRPSLYLPNGVDTDLFHPVSESERKKLRVRLGWPPERKVRLFVGRFVEKKGLPLLRQLAAARPNDLWVFIGWGPDDPARWKMTNVVSVGALPQRAIVEYYRAADLLVLPSVGEGFPLVVQEAMACGLPALISSETLQGAPDAGEVIANAEVNLPAWSQAIERLDPKPRDSDRIAAFARRWSWDAAAARYSALFKTLIRRRSTRSLAFAAKFEDADQKRGAHRLHAEHEKRAGENP